MAQVPCDVDARGDDGDRGILIDLLLERERARHRRELTASSEQMLILWDHPADSLLNSADEELSAVAVAALRVMTALRRHRRGDPGLAGGAEVFAAVKDDVAQLVDRTRSAVAIHLVLEIATSASR